MKNIIVLFTLLFLIPPSVASFFAMTVQAQSPCYTYTCNMEKAEKALTERNYKAALAYCKAAKVYPQANIMEADSLIEVIFVAIDKEKEKAIVAKKEAERQTILAKLEKDRADEKTEEAEIAAETARLAKLKAESAARAAENAAVGMSYMSTNPTLALRIFETNYQQHADNPVAAANFKKMLNDSTEGFYVRNFVAHTEAITAMAVFSDSSWVLTGSTDNTARLWDMQTGKIIRHFVGHTEGVTSVAFSTDGKRILTGSSDKTAKLWDIRTGKLIRQFVGHTSNVSAVAFLPDGKRIMTGSWDRTARLWDIKTGEMIRDFIGQKDGITCITLSESGRRLVTGSWDNTATLWIVETGRMVRTFVGHTNTITSAMLSANGKRLLTGSIDRTAKLWDVETGRITRDFFGHTASVTSVILLPYVNQVVTGSKDGSAKLWDVETGKTLMEFWGHEGAVNAIAVPTDRQWLLTGGNDKTAMMWRLKRGNDITAQFAYPFSTYTFKKLGFQYEDSMWYQSATLRDTLANTRGEERYTTYHKRLAKTWVRSPLYLEHKQKLDAWLSSPLVRVRNKFIGDSILRVGKSIEEIWHYRIDTTKNQALKQQLHQMIIDTLYSRYAQNPNNEVLKYKAIDACIDAMQTAFKAKDYKLAKTFAQKGLDIDKTDAEAHFALADALLFGGNTKKAEALYLGDYLTRPRRDTIINIDEMTEEKTVRVKVTTKPANVIEHIDNLKNSGFEHPEFANIMQKARAKGIVFVEEPKRYANKSNALPYIQDETLTLVEILVNKIEKSRDTLDIYRLYGELVSTIEKNQRLVDNYETTFAYYLSQRAWYGLFVQKYKEAEQDAQRAMRLDPNQSFIKSNLGHALLYQDQFDAAMKVYLDFVDDATNYSGITNKLVLLQDFDDLEAAGKGHKDIEKVKARLNQLNH